MQSVVKPLTDFREHDIKGVNVCAKLVFFTWNVCRYLEFELVALGVGCPNGPLNTL